ncbi:uncharacterized protein LOC133187884 [Saccostrea echinata]|uniref:uncharacterized protein LOC133187884 n=1 Tax=Saccostrea echinata TaxID=191078 RepID=UPI002A82F376|nr:uncharacterized protein LOC133187884 [Saccostrea echinata]
MFPSLTVVVVCLGLVSAGSLVKRQAGCPDPFTNVPNPCVNNVQGRIYYPHPSDASKFIQCDLLGRMYIIQCPQGLTYKASTSSCSTVGGGSLPTVMPATTTTQAPVPVVTSKPSSNPCSVLNINRGNIYFAYAFDKYRFIECDLLGNANILNCPSGLVWEQSRLSCVYDIGTDNVVPNPAGTGTGSGTGMGTGTGSGTGTGGTVDLTTLCAQKGSTITTTDDLFHPYPGDKSKFIQCDLWGQANVVDCPTNLIWNEISKTCAAPYIVNGVPAQSLTG